MFKKRGVFIKLDSTGYPVYSNDQTHWYASEREAKERRLADKISESKAIAADMLNALLSLEMAGAK